MINHFGNLPSGFKKLIMKQQQQQRRRRRIPSLRLVVVLSLLCVSSNIFAVGAAAAAGAATTTTSTTNSPSIPRSSIPRSTNTRRRYLVSKDDESSNSGTAVQQQQQSLPWNPSPKIDANGFLLGQYYRQRGEWEKELRLFRNNDNQNTNLKLPCRIRQVPGDGNCLFHSISMCLYYALNGTHWDIASSNANNAYEDLYYNSYQLRKAAVECLSQSLPSSYHRSNHQNNQLKKKEKQTTLSFLKSKFQNHGQFKVQSYNNKLLYLQGREFLHTSELIQAASQQYGITPEEYCACMEQESVWGGGPEIVALSNVLQRPIHVYELATSTSTTSELCDNDETTNHNNERSSSSLSSRLLGSYSNKPPPSFVLRRMACFGSPRFDKNEALHILSADSRFPDIQPGQQLPAGNHFLAVFPMKHNEDNDNNDDSNGTNKKFIFGTSTNNRFNNVNSKDRSQSNNIKEDDDDLLKNNQRKKKKQRIRCGGTDFAMNKKTSTTTNNNRIIQHQHNRNDSSPISKLQHQISHYHMKWIVWWKDIMTRILLG